MATPARVLVGWTEQRWQAVQEAVDKTFAGTAKCRQVVPKGPEMIGQKAVVVSNLAPPARGAAIAYSADSVAGPINIYVDTAIDEQHENDELAVTRLLEAAAAELGRTEDQEIIEGGAPPAAGAAQAVRAGGGKAGGAAAAAAPAPAPVAAPVVGVRVALNPALARAQLAPAAGVFARTAIRMAGAVPNAVEISTAISEAMADLDSAGRPGSYGLLLHNNLLATLRLPLLAGGPPVIQQVETLIGSNEVAGTRALAGVPVRDDVCGVLFRLDPPAIDLVQTKKPTITVLGRNAGQTQLRIEEEIVLRILDPTAVHLITY